MSVFLPMAALLGGGAVLDVADVFSTDLWTGNGSTQTITNGIDLSGEGGLVWIANRTGAVAPRHIIFDSERGASSRLYTDSISSASSVSGASFFSSFNSNGYTVSSANQVNENTESIVGWSFRKAAKFFDVVTYTGDGVSGRAISHNLGSVPGCIIVKRTDSLTNWVVYHRANTAAPETDYLVLNDTAATVDGDPLWNDTAPTESVFYVSNNTPVNSNGRTYVAYLFAHDTSDSGIIQCGSYTGNGSSTGPTVTLGWEPQWVLVKSSSLAGQNWTIVDSVRGAPPSGNTAELFPNTSGAERSAFNVLKFNSTGFQTGTNVLDEFNASGETYIYMAIRAEGA